MTDPQSPATDPCFSDKEKDAVFRLIRLRRDVRHFRPDPLPDGVLRRILEMAHLAPSVGFMQPWNFVLITSLEVRCRIRDLFEVRNAQELQSIGQRERRELYSRLKLEGILEAPLNVAVTCDHRRDAPFVLGRAPMPQTDLFSTCLAVQNLWLAARAENVGVGWVSILDPQAMREVLHLPEGVELVAYLCIGYPVEFRPRPMLEEIGWKGRLTLGNLVFHDRWGVSSDLFDDERE